MRTPITRQSGFSLVELMVALVLGLILTSGVISVYITSKNTYSINNALGAVQQHGRFSFGFMDPKVRMAGFMGCYYFGAYPTASNQTGLAGDVMYSFAAPVQGFEYTGTGINGSFTPTASDLSTPPANAALWSPALSGSLYTAISGTILKGSDVFVVSEMQANAPALIAPYDDTVGKKLYVSTTDHDNQGNTVNDTVYFSVGTIALANNCSQSAKQTSMFAVTNRNVTAGTISYGSLTTGGHYDASGATTAPAVGAFQSYAFYIGKGADLGPALWEAYLNNTGGISTQELVSGVENMQVAYGVDTDGDKIPNTFETADNVGAGNWPSVVSVRVGLVTRSDDNAIENKPSAGVPIYLLAADPSGNALADGMTFTPLADRRLRKYFVRTFTLRNGMP